MPSLEFFFLLISFILFLLVGFTMQISLWHVMKVAGAAAAVSTTFRLSSCVVFRGMLQNDVYKITLLEIDGLVEGSSCAFNSKTFEIC